MKRGYAAIGLDRPKNGVNVGHALRASGCYGASILVVSGFRYHDSATDTMKVARRIPLVQVDDLHDAIPWDCVPVAVELKDGAKPLHNYSHPERAFYVFGPEDGTLGSRILTWCRDVIYVPTFGCMNLAACVNVVLYDRAVKRNEWATDEPLHFTRNSCARRETSKP